MVKTVTGNLPPLPSNINSENNKSQDELKTQLKDSGPPVNQKIKVVEFKDKVEPKIELPGLEDESIEKLIHENEDLVNPIKIKADVFKDKVNQTTDNTLATEDNYNFKNKSNANSSNSKLNINSFNFSVNKSGKQTDNNQENYETKDYSPAAYVSLQFDNATAQIKDLISKNSLKNEQYSSNAFNNETMYFLSDAVKILEQYKAIAPTNLDKMTDIINMIVSGQGDKLSDADLKELKEFCLEAAESAEKMDLSKSDFQSIATLIDGVMVARENVKGKKEAFINQAEITGKKLLNLITVVSDPKLKIDSNFVEMLTIVKAKYAAILDSRDPVAIAIYSAYLDKIMQALEDIKSGKQKDPSIFRKIQTEYENFAKGLFHKLGNGQVPVEELKNFMGEAAGPVISMLEIELKESKAKGHKSARSLSNLPPGTDEHTTVHTGPTTTEDTTINEKRKKLLTFPQDESSKISKISLISVRKSMENDAVSFVVSDVRSSVEQLNKKSKELASAELNLRKTQGELVKFLSSENFYETWKKFMDGSGLEENNLPEIIEALILKAERMIEEMDLSVDPAAADMSELLKKFREIIVELDLELRRINKKEDDQELLDEKFSKALRDNRERQEMLDKARNEAVKDIEKLQDKNLKPAALKMDLHPAN